ncbi:MAG: AzlC family ABC transporter permease [Clostridiales bacterium]|jgi:4-azaleucine resistance transporter AzlC|nr:AzlC family ABC transporter permease [Clostridiales bacterium]
MLSLLRADKDTLMVALKSSAPVIFGYIPTGFIFGVLIASAGYNVWAALCMSLFIYAGAGQYLAVSMLASGASFFDMAIMTFLINSKHLFYGLSLIEAYKVYGIQKLYMIFSLTDETYAIMTNPRDYSGVNKKAYMALVSVIDHAAWVTGSVLGAIFTGIIEFEPVGLDFAMTALFIVIVIEQFRSYKTKVPFIAGGLSGLFVCLFINKGQILLFGTLLTVIILIIFRKKIEADDNR